MSELQWEKMEEHVVSAMLNSSHLLSQRMPSHSVDKILTEEQLDLISPVEENQVLEVDEVASAEIEVVAEVAAALVVVEVASVVIVVAALAIVEVEVVTVIVAVAVASVAVIVVAAVVVEIAVASRGTDSLETL